MFWDARSLNRTTPQFISKLDRFSHQDAIIKSDLKFYSSAITDLSFHPDGLGDTPRNGLGSLLITI